MNPEQLRHTVKTKWLDYYQENRHWIVRLALWSTYRGQRRPTSSFILGVLSVLEPRLVDALPVIVELSNDPDRVISALGLNFNPDDELARQESPPLLTPESRLLPPKPFVSNRAEEHAENAKEAAQRRTESSSY
ncbi:DUF5331 domain-containing protein [Candidatus Synechococcus calcipolaris G9]|uniref:DUF5331 domain-containing protein n=1 Tax=Candidatus Synechococcus calcipolaris G9 TaxID=1497997 RepID=A0ABT6F099_9SYNE|nr:DUF5331 domain-containing protein [Candidatus Synechococcus calcipolaris]MDG2991294.1 DUF5331 domain-containing protein [Candidatus Synechococcus calcipolaris G9]